MTWVLWQCFPAPTLALQCLPTSPGGFQRDLKCVLCHPEHMGCGMATLGNGRASTGLEGLSSCSELQFLYIP